MLQSKNTKILSASLRFLQLFGKNYCKKSELIDQILKVNNNNTNVKIEQIIALSYISDKESSIVASFLSKSLKNKSWLVSRITYKLINSLEHKPARMELIQKYKTINSEAEKLLILSALKNNFDKDIFGFLTNELLTVRNSKIKNTIFSMLSHSADSEIVLNWLDQHYSNFSKDDIVSLAGYYQSELEDNFSSSLLAVLIKHGFAPDEEFIKKLYESIAVYANKGDISHEEQGKLNNLLKIKNSLVAKEATKGIWDSLVVKEKITKEMQVEYQDAVVQFISKMEEILKKYKINEDKIKEVIDEMSTLKEGLPYLFNANIGE